MGWSQLTLCTDADLGTLEPEATNGHWRNVTWPNQRAEAKRDLKIALEVDFPHIPDVADRIKDTHKPEILYGYTGGSYVDWTREAGSADEDDLALATIFTTFGSDRLYVGSSGEFDGLSLRMLSNLNAAAATLTVKYSGPSGWTALTVVNGTISGSATFAKSGRITWTMPSNWERRTLGDSADAYFWIELSVSAALTASTSATQLLVVKAPDPLKRIVALRALGYIVHNMAAQAPSTDYWAGRATNQFKTGYWDRADAIYASLRDKGGIPIDLDGDETVSEGEAHTVAPIRMGRA